MLLSFDKIKGILQRLTSEEAYERLQELGVRLTLEEKIKIREEALNLGEDKASLPILGLNYVNPDPVKLKLAAYLLLLLEKQETYPRKIMYSNSD